MKLCSSARARLTRARVFSTLAALLSAALPAQASELTQLRAAWAQYESGQRDAGRRVIEETAAREPGNAEAAYYNGRLAMNAGKFDAAARAFEAATARAGGQSLYWQWLGRASGMQARLAGVLAQVALTGKLRAALERAVALDGANLAARDDLATFYMEAPVLFGGGLGKARAQAAEIARQDPYLGDITAGEIFQVEKRHAEAERAFLRALVLAPERTDALTHLAELYNLTGAYTKTFAVCEKLAALDARRALLAKFYFGEAGALAGERLDEAAAALRAYLLVPWEFDTPSPATARYRLGQIAERRGDPALARREYAEALRLDPADRQVRAALRRLGAR